MRTSQDIHEEVDLDLDMVGKNELVSWKQHPVTQLLIKSLKGDLLYRREAWEDGAYLQETVEKTAIINTKVVGEITTIKSIIEWIEHLGEEYDHTDRVQDSSKAGRHRKGN